MDHDLEGLSREALAAEVRRLRAGIRAHRDSTGHELCWHHPALWGLLPEAVRPEVAVPPWPEFLRGCVRYRESLDRELGGRPAARGEAAEPGLPAAAPDLEANKRAVLAFYDLAFNQGRPREAIERFAGAEYVQHNPRVADGPEGFVDYFERLAREHPRKRVTFLRVVAEGPFVVVHCRTEWPGAEDWAGIDIFRLDAAGRIVEHWDVLQAVPEQAANPNTMF